MFAGAAREVVFANPEVVRRINADFIPVALKAGLVNNPPGGKEGDLYAEIARSKPVPQGICTVNSDGKVLSWALSFDDDRSIVRFLDHVAGRYRESPDADQPVTAERFMKFPSRQLGDVKDNGRRIRVLRQHASDSRCPALPAVEEGTLVGRIFGRPLDTDGKPIAATLRQEDYMEARFEVSVSQQNLLVRAADRADGKRFAVPDGFARTLITPAFLGQLDVNPMGGIPGSRNDSRQWEFFGEVVASAGDGVIRIHLEGESDVEGGADARGRRTDGRRWEHRVSLRWQGFVDLKDGRLVSLSMIADGTERLRWGNSRLQLTSEADVEHLMAGHPIDLNSSVRYGLTASPAEEREIVSTR